ncbi:MAG: hypothetical protein J6332_02185 [Abditibacteriota bacterium]|nr:hypothetical protein [Abditibacteriota bacterium]
MRICLNCNLILKETDYICPKCDKESILVDPDSAAHAYNVGNIYETNGQTEEAAVWYRLAAEREPLNEEYKLALDRITALSAAHEKLRSVLISETGDNITHQNALPFIIAAMVIALLLTGYFIFRATQKGLVDSRRQISSEVTRMPSAKQSGTGTVGTTRRNSGRVSSTAPASRPTSSENRNANTRTSGESSVSATLMQSEAIRGNGASVDDVIADPRAGTVTITLVIPASTASNRNSVLNTAAIAAATAAASNGEIREITVRCVTKADGANQIVFVGDTTSEAMRSLTTGATAEDINAGFANQWWRQ